MLRWLVRIVIFCLIIIIIRSVLRLTQAVCRTAENERENEKNKSADIDRHTINVVFRYFSAVIIFIVIVLLSEIFFGCLVGRCVYWLYIV